MIIAIVSFRLPQSMTLAQAEEAFEQTAPRYLGMPGLVRKHDFVTESGDRAGGIYLLKSRADGAACYIGDWRATVSAKYGSDPPVASVENPVIADIVAGRIERT